MINPIPIIAPMKKAKKRATKMFGKDKIKPIKKANFISPTPIHFPWEIKTIIKKKSEARKAERRGFANVWKFEIRNSKFGTNPKSQILNN